MSVFITVFTNILIYTLGNFHVLSMKYSKFLCCEIYVFHRDMVRGSVFLDNTVCIVQIPHTYSLQCRDSTVCLDTTLSTQYNVTRKIEPPHHISTKLHKLTTALDVSVTLSYSHCTKFQFQH